MGSAMIGCHQDAHGHGCCRDAEYSLLLVLLQASWPTHTSLTGVCSIESLWEACVCAISSWLRVAAPRYNSVATLFDQIAAYPATHRRTSTL